MARACNHALRLLPNPITAQLPSSGSRGRRRSLAVHARSPTEDEPKTMIMLITQQQPSHRRKSKPHRCTVLLDCCRGESTIICLGDPRRLIVCCTSLVFSIQSLRRSSRRRESLVSVGTSCGGGEQWRSDFDLTLRQLHLDDLVEDGQSDAGVLVHLLVQQHTQFGMSIKGRVLTSFRKICDSCSSPYCTNIDENFDLTVLSSSRKNQSGLPDLGDSDPSVVYVRPGEEIDLDSVIQETVRLTASAKSSCSEACEKSTVVWRYSGNQKKSSSSQRWSKLLDLNKTLDKAPK